MKIPATPSTAHARKMLMDFMDSKRPWASCKDVYVMMEEIADYAAFAFHGDRRPTKEEVTAMERDLMRFTQPLSEHPEDYDGPCGCAECRQSAS